jgi:hypothetical protein
MYEIKIKGKLSQQWAEWLGNLAITHDDKGNTCLKGAVPDQAALHGILLQIRNLGLDLISINPLIEDWEEGKGDENGTNT